MKATMAIAGLAVLAGLGWNTPAEAAAMLEVAGSSTYDQVTSNGMRDGGMYAAPGWGVNSAGTAVGYSRKYVSGSDKGDRAVRWDAGGTAATELDNLGLDTTGITGARAYAINNAGTAVGYCAKYDSGDYKGTRAVRWNAGGTAATELGTLGMDGWDSTDACAYAVNNAGTAVGYCDRHALGNSQGRAAVR